MSKRIAFTIACLSIIVATLWSANFTIPSLRGGSGTPPDSGALSDLYINWYSNILYVKPSGPEIHNDWVVVSGGSGSGGVTPGFSATNIASGLVDNTEFNLLDGLTSIGPDSNWRPSGTTNSTLTGDATANSFTAGPVSGTGQITLGSSGVRITDDGDGAIKFASLGNGAQEGMTFNLDDVTDEVTVTSDTGVVLFNYSGISLKANNGTFNTLTVNDDPYDATTWNGSTNVPTKNAVRDKIEAIAVGSGANWTASGSTNSTLLGNAFVYGLTATNGLTVIGSSPSVAIGDSGSTLSFFLSAPVTLLTNVFLISPTAPEGGLVFASVTAGTNMTLSATNVAGDVTISGKVITIANAAVTYAKMQNVSAASKLLGRGDSGAGAPQEITLGTGLTMTGTTLAASGGGGGSATNVIGSVGITIDGGGSAITTGVKGYIEVPYACGIDRYTMLADQSGSAVVDIWKCTYSQFDAGATHPVTGDKITASAPPTITTATKGQSATLTGWTTNITAGDIIGFSVTSATTITRLTVQLKVTSQ